MKPISQGCSENPRFYVEDHTSGIKSFWFRISVSPWRKQVNNDHDITESI